MQEELDKMEPMRETLDKKIESQKPLFNQLEVKIERKMQSSGIAAAQKMS
jgi:hypothetical protein